MSKITRWMDRKLYPRHADDWDNTAFREAILINAASNHHVLDLGAGAGIVEQTRFPNEFARICGVDPDPRVLENPYLNDAKIGFGEAIAYDDESFDMVFCNNVLEHLENPEEVFTEVARVLKPGGCFLAKTPNRWHYMPMIASCTPHWFHEVVNRMRGRDDEDTFPTRYRANSPGALQRIAAQVGLEVEQVQLIEGRPEYLRMSAPTYLAGWLYERTVNLVPGLSRLRVVMVSVLRKPLEDRVEARAAA